MKHSKTLIAFVATTIAIAAPIVNAHESCNEFNYATFCAQIEKANAFSYQNFDVQNLTYIYSCRKCGLTIQKSRPGFPSGACPQGGSHNWTMTTY